MYVRDGCKMKRRKREEKRETEVKRITVEEGTEGYGEKDKDRGKR